MAMSLAAAAASTPQCLSDVNPDGANPFIEKLLVQIYKHFDGQYLIDVTFKLSNPTALVTAHRLILSAASPYFKELFQSGAGIFPLIEITDIDSDTFERLITFCYTGKTLITMDNINRMLKAAMILQLDDAVANCVDFLIEHISDYTLERIYALECEAQCELLSEKILEYEIGNFMGLIQSAEFLNFDASKLQTILESDDLNVPTERDVFEAVRRWYDHKAPARKQHLPDIISCLRLTQFDTNFLLSNIQPLPGCHTAALEALSWVNIPSSRATIPLRFTNSRRGQTDKSADIQFLAFNRSVYGGESRTILQYNKTEDVWQKWVDIQLDIEEYSAIFMEENLIFIGGVRNEKIINEVRSWNLKTKTFQQLCPMKEPRSMHCAVILNDKIYAIGGKGIDNKHLETVEMCSVSHGWKQIQKMTTPRAFVNAVILNQKIYVIGGYNGDSLRSVECYDPTTNCWSPCSDMNEVHVNHGAAVHNGQIFVVGSWNDEGATPIVERYDPERDEWTKIRSLDTGRHLTCCSLFDNQLWAVGGKINEIYKDFVSVYNEQNDEWIDKKPMPLPGWYYCFTVPNGVL